MTNLRGRQAALHQPSWKHHRSTAGGTVDCDHQATPFPPAESACHYGPAPKCSPTSGSRCSRRPTTTSGNLVGASSGRAAGLRRIGSAKRARTASLAASEVGENGPQGTWPTAIDTWVSTRATTKSGVQPFASSSSPANAVDTTPRREEVVAGQDSLLPSIANEWPSLPTRSEALPSLSRWSRPSSTGADD